MKKKIGLVLFVFISITSAVFAARLSSIGFLSGYLQADLKEKNDYEAVPVMVVLAMILSL